MGQPNIKNNKHEEMLRIAQQAGISAKYAQAVLERKDAVLTAMKMSMGYYDLDRDRAIAAYAFYRYVNYVLQIWYASVLHTGVRSVVFERGSYVSGKCLIPSSDGGAEWRVFDLSNELSSVPIEDRIEFQAWVELAAIRHQFFQKIVDVKLLEFQDEIAKNGSEFASQKSLELINERTAIWAYLGVSIYGYYLHNAKYKTRLRKATEEMLALRDLILNYENSEALTVVFRDECLIVESGQQIHLSITVKDAPYLYHYMFAEFTSYDENVERVLWYLHPTSVEWDGTLTDIPLTWAYSIYPVDLKPLNAEHEQALRKHF